MNLFVTVSFFVCVFGLISGQYYYYRDPNTGQLYYYAANSANRNPPSFLNQASTNLNQCDYNTLYSILAYFSSAVPPLCPTLVASCPILQQYITTSPYCQTRFRANLIHRMCCLQAPSTTPQPTTTSTAASETDGSSTTSTSTTTTPAPRTCGVSTVTPANTFQARSLALATLRIVGGSDATKCEYPWIAKLRVGDYLCGATIIDETHVLTAAHCVAGFDQSTMSVVLGEHDLSSTTGDEQTRQVSKIDQHEDYNPDNFRNDVALITLSEQITYSDCVQPACLPSAGQSWPKGTECVAAGWGVLTEQGSLPTVLQEVTVPYYSGTDCLTDFPGYSSSDIFSETSICAGYPEGQRDACQGDSGGPLVCPDGDSWYVAGVVSTGYGCARPGYPGIYTNVASYIDWLSGKM